jgi:hypothetical protein
MTAPITRKSTVEEVGAIVCQAVSDAGIDAVLTGGLIPGWLVHRIQDRRPRGSAAPARLRPG